ncbi:MAG: aspartate carbamoyltransferase [Burkholderiaceae bacterium]
MNESMNEQLRGAFGLATVVMVLLLASAPAVFAQTSQAHIHPMARGVMPFDMDKTLHIFQMTESGGVQKVIARSVHADDQVALIQQHLKHEAERFRLGDFADPATLHGADMPGLKELQAGASAIKISYKALPAGAEITFETTDLHLITAIHRWFGAQLSEHGADAKAK